MNACNSSPYLGILVGTKLFGIYAFVAANVVQSQEVAAAPAQKHNTYLAGLHDPDTAANVLANEKEEKEKQTFSKEKNTDTSSSSDRINITIGQTSVDGQGDSNEPAAIPLEENSAAPAEENSAVPAEGDPAVPAEENVVEEAPPTLDHLVDQFLTTGKAIEQRAGGTEPIQGGWYDTLIVTKSDNPLLERGCQRDALQGAVDRLAEAKHLDHHQAIIAAQEHMSQRQAFLTKNGISYAGYLKEVAKCRDFCAPLVASLIQCHILAVSKHPHGIVLFPYDSFEVDRRYIGGMLNTVKDRLQDPGLEVLLIGRASNIGDLHYNRRLSGQRALAVSDQLQEKGVPPERIKVMWFGWEPPQIDERVAQEYGIEDLYNNIGNHGLNQSVVIVLYPRKSDGSLTLLGDEQRPPR